MNPPEHPDTRNVLEDLDRSIEPPPELEDWVVGALRREGLIRTGPGRSWWILAAACLASMLLGWTVRGWIPATPTAAPAQEFLLLLSEPKPLRTTRTTPELVQEYRSWAENLSADGRMVAAARLEPREHRLVGPASGGMIREPDASAATGFFVVRAASWDEALEIAASCPHLTYGGEISVRPVAGGSSGP